jgi:hypothetical protein
VVVTKGGDSDGDGDGAGAGGKRACLYLHMSSIWLRVLFGYE